MTKLSDTHSGFKHERKRNIIAVTGALVHVESSFESLHVLALRNHLPTGGFRYRREQLVPRLQSILLAVFTFFNPAKKRPHRPKDFVARGVTDVLVVLNRI